MTIVSKVEPQLESIKIIGITTSQGCSKDAQYTISLQNTESVTETTSFTTGLTRSFTFGASLSVAAEASASFLGTGGKITVTGTVSTSATRTWSNSETKATSSSSSSSVGQSTVYKGI